MFEKENHSRIIEFNTDDMNPQDIPVFIERVIQAGASDAFVIPVIMKKGRPGYLFKITCAPEYEEAVLEIIFSDTTTIGVRKILAEGIMLARKAYEAETLFGKIRVKEVTLPNGEVKIQPEFEEVKRIADGEKLSLDKVRSALLSELNKTK